MPAANGARSERPEASAMVWIEDGSGSIARGLAGAISARGARVRLAGPPSFEAGAEVALRICFERGAPTVGTTARVSFLRDDSEGSECGLEWTAAARQTLAPWLAPTA
jgi:hypothetical protein